MLKITVSGNANIAITDLARKARELHKPMKEAVVFMERETKKNFLTETDPDGGAWAGLKPSTLKTKKTSSILRETASLANSVASESSARQGRVYATQEYGIYHMTGTSKMEAREFIGIGDDHQEKIKKIFVAHFGT